MYSSVNSIVVNMLLIWRYIREMAFAVSVS